jgi:carbon-monoxide dehydrogenase small subunit
MTCPSPHLLLAAAALRTSHIRLATAVTVLPLYSPVRVAEEAGTLDLLSNGRFELGIGRGVPGEVELGRCRHAPPSQSPALRIRSSRVCSKRSKKRAHAGCSSRRSHHTRCDNSRRKSCQHCTPPREQAMVLTPSVDRQLRLSVNGIPFEVTAPNRRTLVDLLRYDLGLTGTKEACSVGVCGVCSVLLNGRLVASCLLLAAQADGAEITTIEGIANSDGELDPLQRSFIEHGGFQCGICTPGQIIAARALLDEIPSPTEQQIKDWMMGNLCRCTGYYQIVESIKAAV